MQNKFKDSSDDNVFMSERVHKIASFKGVDIYRIKTGKFKTNSINFFFMDNLTRENVTSNALIPAVLRRGCKQFPTFRDIALNLEELYGAGLDCGVSKKGECHIIQFYTEYMSDSYAAEGAKQFERAFDLLFGIINEPVLENGVFKEEYLAQEKDNLKKLIDGRINDKMQYSVEKCFEEMCSEEPYGIYEYGYTSDLEKIGSKELYEKYMEMLTEYPLQVYLSGDMDDACVQIVLERLNSLQRNNLREISCCSFEKTVDNVKSISEKMNITQGKLTMGFRTNTSALDGDYYSLIVYNGILGGGIHSKLFQNVREKAGLAYYAFSRLEKLKGLLVIGSGIDFNNKDKAQKIIMQQLEEIKNGNISDYEFESTLKTIETGIKSLLDSQMQIVDFYLSQAIAGTDDTFDSIAEKVKKVKKEHVVSISRKINLDTVYFLDGNNAAGGSNEN